MNTPPNRDQQTSSTSLEIESDRDHPSQQFNVSRPIYQQRSLDKLADYHFTPRPFSQMYARAMQRCGYEDCFRNIAPVIKWLPRYKARRFFLSDFVAGTTVAVLNVPLGMAGSLLAEAPPVMGLYMSFYPIFIYVIFGMSPHIAIGTFAVTCLMAAKVVEEHAMDTDDRKAQYTPLEALSALTCLVGIFQVFMWALRLGALSTLLSEPVVSGFTTGASFQAATSQLKDLFGVKLPRLPPSFKVVNTVIEMFKHIAKTNWVTFLISFCCCFILAVNNDYLKPWFRKRYNQSIPMELLVIITTTIMSKYLHLRQNYGVTIIGSIPTGLPKPASPQVALFELIIIDGVIHTFVTYSITLSMELLFTAKENYEIDANQELFALGLCNLFASFFSCAPTCASLSRTNVQYAAGCKTLVTGIVTALWIFVVLMWIGPLFEQVPRCVLASIMVVSLKGLFMQVMDLKKFWKLSGLDAGVWMVTFLFTMLGGIDIGLASGLFANLAALFYRSQTAYTCLLGRMKKTDIYLDIKRYRVAQEIPGVKIYHYCGGLNFATKTLFRSSLYRKIGFKHPNEPSYSDYAVDSTAVPSVVDPYIHSRVKCVIIDATALSYVDAPGIKCLVDMQSELNSSRIVMLLAGANVSILEMVGKYNALESDALEMRTFPTVHDAVIYYKIKHSKKPNPPRIPARS